MFSITNLRDAGRMLSAMCFGALLVSFGFAGLHALNDWFVVCMGVTVLVLEETVYLFDKNHPRDPWALQRRIMDISDQHQPQTPQLNKSALMYWALVAEELSETGEAMASTTFAGKPPAGIYQILLHLSRSSHHLRQASLELRDRLQGVDDNWAAMLEPNDAEAILDGVSDMAVTVFGLSIAAGLPGSQAYEEVQASNLSKRNPITGLIERDPSGKWIKGSGYQPPDLSMVLKKAYDKARDSAEFNSIHSMW